MRELNSVWSYKRKVVLYKRATGGGEKSEGLEIPESRLVGPRTNLVRVCGATLESSRENTSLVDRALVKESE